MVELEDKSRLKPMLFVDEMISYLKNKNIKFNYISENDALKYLKSNNNYYNLTSYKHNFEKYMFDGRFVDKYIDLDFAYLKDLSIIDYRVRLVLFKMIINIEHYLKMKILNTIENIDEEDGYRIVNLYLDKDFNSDKFPKKLHNSIFKKVGSEYYQKIFSKYDIDKDKKLENIPIWEFLEIITFGELVNFYEFYTKEYGLREESKDVYILRDIVKLRNAVAHNSCILSDLGNKNNNYPISYKIINFLESCDVGKEMRIKKLSNSRIKQITYTLYMFNKIVTSDGIKENVINEINDLFYNRIIYHKEYYNNNELLKSVYAYFEKIIEKFYKKILKIV
ncbi:MAG TPA: Abi family protein [Candidatus Onthousia excrementipullorum]|uniref:Abi family protein n=1 Tax=Candidatus Onthousia excrementipullorum TaxID=2840884 RepID=A0A9D1DU58_9FIRM|nr:Abi family protein [Candidatus Onthousia excrementipullorum]